MIASIKIEKQNGKVQYGRRKLFNTLSRLDDETPYHVKIDEWEDKRSLRQNNLYWKWLTVIGNELGYHKDELHEVFIDHYADIWTVRGLDGKPKQKRVRTSQMSVDQMSEYMDRIAQFAAEHNITLPTPEEEMI